jgi:hypothetical protein
MQHIVEYDRSSSACSQRTESEEGFEHDNGMKASDFSLDSDDDRTAFQRKANAGKNMIRCRDMPDRETAMQKAAEEEEGHGEKSSSRVGDDDETTESTMGSRGLSMMSKLS